MGRETLTKEQELNAINLVATMVVSDLARQKNESPTQMLLTFMESRTADALYDSETKLWCEGPDSVEALFLAEQKNK